MMIDQQYILHGRPLKIGGKVYSIYEHAWLTVVEPNRVAHPGSVSIPHVGLFPSNYAWDEPPAVDLASIPPPLCWIEGHPVRKGTAMMHKGELAVVFLYLYSVDNCAQCLWPDGKESGCYVSSLTFALPPNTRPMKKVIRTLWFNKYPNGDAGLHETEEIAKQGAMPNSQGQQSVTFEVEVPA